MTTSKSGTLIHALMTANGLGMSANKRTVQEGVVSVNNVKATNLDTPVVSGDTIRVGKRQTIEVA